LQWKTFLKRLDGTPALVDRTSFVGANTALYQIDSGGRTLWSTDTGTLHGFPAIDADRVYVGSDRGVLFAMDRKTGQIAWQFTGATSSLLTRPAVAEKLVVIESTDNNVYGVEASTGKQRWKFNRADGSLGYSAPRYDSDTKSIYVAGETSLYRLDATTGKQLWIAYIGGKSTSAPDVGGSRVYVGGDSTGLSAFSISSGAPLWNFKGERADDWFGPPLYAAATVYVTTYSRYVYAVDAVTGKQKWSYRLPGNALAQPALDVKRSTLYVTSGTFRDNPTITALDIKTGKFLWSYRAGYIAGAPVISADRLFVGSTNGYYYAFSLD